MSIKTITVQNFVLEFSKMLYCAPIPCYVFLLSKIWCKVWTRENYFKYHYITQKRPSIWWIQMPKKLASIGVGNYFRPLCFRLSLLVIGCCRRGTNTILIAIFTKRSIIWTTNQFNINITIIFLLFVWLLIIVSSCPEIIYHSPEIRPESFF